MTSFDGRISFQLVPDAAKHMLNEWVLRVLIIISLSTQMMLLVLGNVRKCNPRTRIRISLWFASLLGSTVTTAALGVISSQSLSQFDKPITSELMSFWASFLLLHLGGSDTITSFSLEDNELWLRHFVNTLFQSGVAIYILLLSWKGRFQSHLPQLSVLIYVVGFIKCFERLQALRLANTDNLRDSMIGPADPGPNYLKFVKDFQLKKSMIVKLGDVNVPEPLLIPSNDHHPQGEGKVISEAYHLFQTFKRLFVDLIITFKDRDSSQSYFRHLQSDDAFRVVEIELGFAYDMLYTKASMLYTFKGFMLALITTSVFFIILVIVGYGDDNYHFIDIVLTYLLIGSAIVVEIFSVITMLRSDWADHWLSQQNLTRNILIFPFFKHPTKQRWSGSIAQLDLLSVALDEKPANFFRIQKFFGIDNILLNQRYKTYTKVSDNLKDLIYCQFREFMVLNSDPKGLCTHKGDFSLRKNECHTLVWSINEVEFDQSILIWHIATSLCYYSDLDHIDEVDFDVYHTESKHISDYMLHLLVSYPVMLPIGIGMIRYRDTCAESMSFFNKYVHISQKDEACRKLLDVINCSVVLPRKVMKGVRSKSALFDGCRLALSLRKMEREQMWKVMSQVWIEILAYAAIHCRGFHHKQQLRKGGEFLTHVWLLMAHLGITEHVQGSQNHAN